jgi:hypothetical protein
MVALIESRPCVSAGKRSPVVCDRSGKYPRSRDQRGHALGHGLYVVIAVAIGAAPQIRLPHELAVLHHQHAKGSHEAIFAQEDRVNPGQRVAGKAHALGGGNAPTVSQGLRHDAQVVLERFIEKAARNHQDETAESRTARAGHHRSHA